MVLGRLSRRVWGGVAQILGSDRELWKNRPFGIQTLTARSGVGIVSQAGPATSAAPGFRVRSTWSARIKRLATVSDAGPFEVVSGPGSSVLGHG